MVTYPIIYIKVAIDLIDLNNHNWRGAGVVSTANSEVPPNAGNGAVSQLLSAAEKTGLNHIYFVYIIKSVKFEKYYTGSTENLDRRLKNHNSGKVRSTKAYKPWKIVYTESYDSKSEALKRKKQIKSYKGGNAFKNLISSTK